MRIRWLFLGVVFLLGHSVFGALDLDTIVEEIRLVVPSHSIPIRVTRPAFNFHVGQTIRKDLIRKDINQLMSMGIFSSVFVDTHMINNRHVLDYHVSFNPVVKDVQFYGNRTFDDQYLMQYFFNQINRPLSLNEIEGSKKSIYDLYVSNGYSLYQLEKIDLVDNGLTFYLNEGYISQISIDGLERFQPHSILRDFVLKEESVFNTEHLVLDRQHLQNLGYFSFVSLPIITKSEDNRFVNIRYKVIEKRLNLVDFGLEKHSYQGQTELVSFLQWRFYHFPLNADLINIKMQLFLNEGELDLKSYLFSYYQPWLMGVLPLKTSVKVWNVRSQEIYARELLSNQRRVFENLRFGFSFGFEMDYLYNKLRHQFGYKQEDVQSTKASSDSDYFSPYKIHSFQTGLVWTQLDNLANPSLGEYVKLSYEKGGRLLGMDIGGLVFDRWNINMARFFPVFDKMTFGTRFLLGAFESQSGSDTFEPEGYFLGGTYSLRGFKDSQPFYGNYEYLVNTELRADMGAGFQGVLFCDLGNVGSELSQLSLSNHRFSYGVGVRYISPIGPIRVDLAKGEHTIIHFGLGQVF